MAVLGRVVTLETWAKRVDPNGKVDKIVEILRERNEILDDMNWKEGNLPTGHKTTIRTGIPTPTWRLLNYGVKPDNSETAQITDTCGMLEIYSQVDKKLADLNGNTNEFLLSESVAFLDGMNQELSKTLFYGNTKEYPAKFTGFAPRYSTLVREEQEKEDTSDYTINAGGTGNNCTSIWLVVWGDDVHGIFPKGSKAGIGQTNKGQVTVQDGKGGEYEAYKTHYSWDSGLTVRDFRQVARICNIDTTNLKSMDLVGCLVEAVERINSLTSGKPVLYMNKTIRTALRQEIRKTNNVHLNLDTVEGKRVLFFDEVPVRRVDTIHNQEAALV